MSDPTPPPAQPSPVLRFLRSRWLQGVGAVAGVVAVGLTVLYAQSDDKAQSSTSQQGTGNVIIGTGDGNCVNCIQQQPTPSPSPPLNPLKINPTWPMIHGCDGATMVAVFSGGADPRTLQLPQGADVRDQLIADGGAAFGRGFMYLSLTVTDGSTVEIVNIKPIIFRRSKMEPVWVWDPRGGCGDSYYRSFRLNLDKPSLTDLGVVGNDGSQRSGEPEPQKQPLGSSFHVSQSDPALVEVQAEACSGTYEWGLEVTSVVRGEQRVTRIGSAQQPFRSVGALTAAVPSYSYNMSAPDQVSRAAEEQRPSNCR